MRELTFFAVYNIIVFVIFTLIYAFIDFEKHFGEKRTHTGVFYLATQVHAANSPPGELAPRTATARMLASAHCLASWGQTSLAAVLVWTLLRRPLNNFIKPL